ncbi:cellulose-binding domain-containing protein [Microbulbifer sp. OS29]|uniref:Cellulose-binding domain-containing protein n=1 Tax=Microbulbifer okhotskensis TaxID=2926617 RepID=A0A9X2EP32_9GAMM|nr:cellulose binding domain-containing protein [Microbulbifer okhotskensis]MCO1335792.1 cellulose-binding domain-containing protein [Microbulbifer okhotskensis]
MSIKLILLALATPLLLSHLPVTAADNCNVLMTVQSEWKNGYMASVVVRNTGDEAIEGWTLAWEWPEDQQISHIWNAAVSQDGNSITVEGTGGFATIPVGQAQAFGLNIEYSGGKQQPTNILASCESSPDPIPEEPAPEVPGKEPIDTLSSYNLILGTQTIGPKYTFSDQGSLLESAQAIRDMGSNLLKIALSPSLYTELKDYGLDYQFKQMLEEIPAFKQVLDMDFSYYMFWVEDSGSWMDNQGMSQVELTWQYNKIYALAEHLLTQYDGSGKTFMIGHWEGDWNLVQKTDGTRDDNLETIDPVRIQGLIDWLNIRQKAIDDAKANILHSNVNLFHYVEVNRVESAMQGKERITNAVLPHTSVDLVSYSAYDLTTQEKHSDFAILNTELIRALDFIESKLPEKSGLPFEKRVFIGEYGYGESWFKNWGPRSGEAQDMLSRNVIKTSLAWGAPFILYWQMYGNEYDSWLKEFVGYWLIDNKGIKKEIYQTHQDFYEDARRYLLNYQSSEGLLPPESEFRNYALKWFESPPHSGDNPQPTPDNPPQQPDTPPVPVPPPVSSGQCEVVYSLQSDWGTGFMANIAIRNTGDQPVEHWQVRWHWPDAQKITHHWNADIADQNGSVIAASSNPIAVGEARAFGFNGKYTGTNSMPTPTVSCFTSDAEQVPETPTGDDTSRKKPNVPSQSNAIKIWFIGDSITYGMTTLPYNTKGFRSQIWQHMINAADGKSSLPFSTHNDSGKLSIAYSGKSLHTIGTVSGPTGPDDIPQKTGNYWHSGIPGASTPDMLCFLSPSEHQISSGYSVSSCEESLNYFNNVVVETCRERVGGNGWLSNPACSLTQALSIDTAVVIPIQLGTNDITSLSRNEAINCQVKPTPGSQTAGRLNQVAENILSPSGADNQAAVVGKVHTRLKEFGIPNENIAFIISTIPRRTSLDGQDPSNYCTDYYNTQVRKITEAASRTFNVYLADQGNIVPSGDSVHPVTAQHTLMACNLLYGYASNQTTDNATCPIPKTTNHGLIGALKQVSQ